MEESKPKFQPWTKEEMALLADLMGKAFNAGNNQSEAAAFAATKLGRSEKACLGMYHAKMRKKPLSMWALEPVVEDTEEPKGSEIKPISITLYDEMDNMHKAMILSQTETKVIAKVGNTVIVIDL